MDNAKQERLEEQGWKFGDAEDFLEMRADERTVLTTRITVAD
jgi:hypothetical protein